MQQGIFYAQLCSQNAMSVSPEFKNFVLNADGDYYCEETSIRALTLNQCKMDTALESMTLVKAHTWKSQQSNLFVSRTKFKIRSNSSQFWICRRIMGLFNALDE
jgi:hypothetical protein